MKFSHLTSPPLLILGILLFLFSSCSSDVVNMDVAEEDVIEDPKTAVPLSIEFSTLDEVNALLESNQIEAIAEAFLEINRRERDAKACINAKFKGDLDQDEAVSAQDVLVGYNIISEYDDVQKYPDTANGDQKLDVNKEYLGAQPSFWDVVHVANLWSFSESASTRPILDKNDIAVLVDLVIGQCN